MSLFGKDTYNYINNEIDYEKLAKAIVKAENELLEDKKKEEIKQNQAILAQREQILKVKDCSDIKFKPFRDVRKVLNDIAVFFRLLFIKKENITAFNAVEGLVKMVLVAFVLLLRVLLYVSMPFVVVISYFMLDDVVIGVCLAFFALTIAQIMRIAQYEVDNMNDREYLLTLFAGVTSIISIIVSIIPIFQDGDNAEIVEILKRIEELLHNA